MLFKQTFANRKFEQQVGEAAVSEMAILTIHPLNNIIKKQE